jgi:hypothetical protein
MHHAKRGGAASTTGSASPEQDKANKPVKGAN